MLELDLSHNLLTLLDIDAFSKTPLLFSFKVTDNLLRNWIPENASWPKYVYKLDLSGNKLVHMPPIPTVILRLKENSYLNLKRNPLFCGCKSLEVNSSLNIDIVCHLLITCIGNSNDKISTDFSRLNGNVLSCNKVAASVFTSTMLQRPICVRPKVKTSVRVQFFSLVLHCKAEGFPVPEMSINYKNETLVSGNVTNLQLKLTVGDLQQYICENVTFKCYAESPIGKSESLFELKHTVLEITDCICRTEQNEFNHSSLTTASYNEIVVWKESHILIMIFAILVGITTLSLSVIACICIYRDISHSQRMEAGVAFRQGTSTVRGEERHIDRSEFNGGDVTILTAIVTRQQEHDTVQRDDTLYDEPNLEEDSSNNS